LALDGVPHELLRIAVVLRLPGMGKLVNQG
jgi:hypothetical protein